MPKPFRRSAGISSVWIGFALLVGSCGRDALPIGPTPAPPAPPTEQRSTGPIAFVSDRDGNRAIYLANEDGVHGDAGGRNLRPILSRMVAGRPTAGVCSSS